jgi:cytochrome b subunit of formate dehydrogenase
MHANTLHAIALLTILLTLLAGIFVQQAYKYEWLLNIVLTEACHVTDIIIFNVTYLEIATCIYIDLLKRTPCRENPTQQFQ